ncbi:hypothetical protein FOMPIDRAFT_1056219 [Fomitopsis schrenkii]|uniref:Ribonuclease H1 N-terminal domain-containing protein n=1 Tax=Fomitopsis schrenkii TaxID=2126942 RepID=S8ETX4_FOMSC|nr:hypothetical protein FOMPIDRAFT_1056219 [Fomitopsis schrenkii]
MTPSAARNIGPGNKASNDAVVTPSVSVAQLRDIINGLNMLAVQQEDDQLWAAVDGTPFISEHAVSNEEPSVPRTRTGSPTRQPLPRDLPATPRVSPPPAADALGSGAETPNSSVGSGWTRTSGSTYIPNPPRDNGPSSSGGGSGSSAGNGGGGGGGGGGGIPSCGNCGFGVEGAGIGIWYYCITRGKAVGVFVGWTNASAFVTGVPYAVHQRYSTFALALAAFQDATDRGQVHLVL